MDYLYVICIVDLVLRILSNFLKQLKQDTFGRMFLMFSEMFFSQKNLLRIYLLKALKN